MAADARSRATARAAGCSPSLLVVIVLGAGAGAVPVPRRAAAERRGQDLRLHPAGGELRPAARLHRHRLVRAHDVLRHRRLRRRDRAARAGAELGRDRASGWSRRCRSSLLLALVIGLFSLRVRAIFFAMITLAVASFFAILASQLSGSPAARTASPSACPSCCGRAFALIDEPCSASPSTAASLDLLPRLRLLRWRCSCCCCASSTRRSAACCRRSARTSSAPRRSATAPCATARSPTCRRRAVAALAGALLALWLRYTGPDTTLSFDIMIDILLMVVIGGMGTMYGAVIGATLFVLAQNYLQDADGHRLASALERHAAAAATCSTPTAGCSGSACCSSSASTSSRPASSASCAVHRVSAARLIFSRFDCLMGMRK